MNTTNTEIKKLYNVVKVVSAKDLPNLVKTYKDNLDSIIAMMKRKQPNSKPPKYFTDFVEKQNDFNNKVLAFIETQTKFNEWVVKQFKAVNDQFKVIDDQFKAHGWTK